MEVAAMIDDVAGLRCKFCGARQPPWKMYEAEVKGWFECAYCGRVNRLYS